MEGNDLYNREPSTDPIAVILAFHGLGDHIQRYDHFFQKFADAGILVKGMDYRGHGKTFDNYNFSYWKNIYNQKTTSIKGYTESFDRVFKDMMLLYELEVDSKDLTGLPTFVFGHSLGGLFSLTFSFKHSNLIKNYKGTIAQAPAMAPANPPAALLKLAVMKLGKWVPKVIQDNQLILSGLSSDEKVIERYKSDPFVHRKISVQLAREIFENSDVLYEKADEFSLPVIMYHSESDKLTSYPHSLQFYEKIASQDKTFKNIGAAHELHNEIGDLKWQIAQDYIEWIKKRL